MKKQTHTRAELLDLVQKLDDVYTKATDGRWLRPLQDEQRAIVAALRPWDSLLGLDVDGMAVFAREPDAAAVVAFHNAWPALGEFLRKELAPRPPQSQLEADVLDVLSRLDERFAAATPGDWVWDAVLDRSSTDLVASATGHRLAVVEHAMDARLIVALHVSWPVIRTILLASLPKAPQPCPFCDDGVTTESAEDGTTCVCEVCEGSGAVYIAAAPRPLSVEHGVVKP